MAYVDDKGRPELVVNPAIKLGMAFFKPVPPAETAAAVPVAAPLPVKRVRRRVRATESVVSAPEVGAESVKQRRSSDVPAAASRRRAKALSGDAGSPAKEEGVASTRGRKAATAAPMKATAPKGEGCKR